MVNDEGVITNIMVRKKSNSMKNGRAPIYNTIRSKSPKPDTNKKTTKTNPSAAYGTKTTKATSSGQGMRKKIVPKTKNIQVRKTSKSATRKGRSRSKSKGKSGTLQLKQSGMSGQFLFVNQDDNVNSSPNNDSRSSLSFP